VRIGIVSDLLYPKGKGTGLSRYLSNLLIYLSQIDKENDYILFHRKDSPNPLYEKYEHVNYGKYASRLPLPFFISWEIALVKALKHHPVDLIHEPSGVGLPLLSWPPRNVMTLMDISANLFPRASTLKATTEFRTRLPIALWKTDKVIAPSVATKKDVEKVFSWSRGKISVVPLGLTPDFGRSDDIEVTETLAKYGIHKPYVLMHAVHRWNKNTLGAVEVFHRITQLVNSKEINFVISGGMQPDLQTKVRELASKLGISDKLTMTGYMDDVEVPSLITGTSVFLYPTLYEGFGLPPLEAMMCGAPIVASSVPTMLEILGDAALTAPPHDVESLAKHASLLITDRSLAKEMGLKALRQSQKYTAEKTAKETVDIYKELIVNESRWRFRSC